MKRRLAFLLTVLWLALAGPALAGPGGEDAAPASLDEAHEGRIEKALRDGIGPTDYRALYRASVLESGEARPTIERLEQIADDERVPDPRRQAAAWVAAHLLRQSGERKRALARFEALAADGAHVAASLQQARLLDALGRTRPAWKVWKAALLRIEDESEALEVRLRMALLGKQGGASVKRALAEVASSEGLAPALRNRAAIVLALKGHAAEALALFRSTATGKARFREQVRLAEWALADKQGARAQDFAWAAQKAATLKRDRRYALTLLVEAHRSDKSLDALIARLAAEAELDESAREVWIDLLRETGRVDEALRLFREAADGRFTVDMRRELLEMCREAGQDDVLVGAYREMIAAQPAVTEWREGLSRHFLERGNRKDAVAVWRSYLDDPQLTIYLLAASEALRGIGLDEESAAFAEASIERGQPRAPALLSIFALHHGRGRLEEAEAALERLEAGAAPGAPERMALAEAYEQIGRKKHAVKILEGLSEVRGGANAGEDLEMRLAWLYSEVGDEEQAMARWRTLWRRIESVSRRRYVEDRLMTVAARLGKLADIAIELEEKLAAGQASARDGGLLVRLYTKAGDPISATEIVEEYMKGQGAAPVKVLVEKSRVFLSCSDYHNYEKTIKQLVEVDPDGKGDYLRQLAMSQLERGKPDEARAVLKELQAVESGSDSAEFEAGVLALSGLRKEAVTAYRRGLARYPDRIESLLLMGGLLAEIGRRSQAIGMLQHIAETADKDDLFMIAIDGLLNLDASVDELRWARRITLGRLAGRHDKMYLYTLIAELSEQIGDRDVMLRALEGALPIVGERRSSLLRELMDHTTRPTDRDRHLAYGRRLIGLGEVAPPQVYLDLGRIFLQSGDVGDASKTFSLATEVADYTSFQQQVATAFETTGYRSEALRTYQRLLVSRPDDVAMLTKVGELQEQVGRDDLAVQLYARAMEMMIARRPLSTVIKEKEEPTSRWVWRRARNVDDFDQYYERVLTGLLTTMDEGAAAQIFLTGQRLRVGNDLKKLQNLRAARGATEEQEEDKKQDVLRAWPRIESRARLYRRTAIALARPDLADELDIALLKSLPADEDLLRDLVRERLAWGLVASARALIDASGRPEETRRKLSFLIGATDATAPGLISLLEGNRLFLPLIIEGKEEEARNLLRRLDFSRLSKEDKDLLPVLQSAALQMQDGRLALALGRHWIKVLIKRDKKPDAPYRFRPVLQRIRTLLDEAEDRALCEYVVSLILEDPKQAGNWIQLIPEMQHGFEQPLLGDEQRKDLISKIDGTRWYWIGSLFALVPEGERAAVLRAALPKVPKTQRIQFLLRLIDDIKETLRGDIADLVAQSFDEALKEIERAPEYVWYSFVNLARGSTSMDLRLRLIEGTLKKAPNKPAVRAAYAVLLSKTGRTEEALIEAAAALPGLIGAKLHYSLSNARRILFDEFVPKHEEALRGIIRAHAKAGGGGKALADVRIDLARRSKDPRALLAAYRQAVQDLPDDAAMKNRLYGQLSSMGYAVEALQLMRAMAGKKPEDENLKKRLRSAWLRVGNPVEALALEREIRKKQAEKEGQDGPEKQSTWISVRDIKKAVEAGDEERAAIDLRRLWRSFQTGATNMMRSFAVFNRSRTYTWPLDVTDEEPDEKRLRGGLATFDQREQEPPQAKNLHEVMADFEFGVGEMGRELRTFDGPRLSGAGTLLDGLAAGRARQEGVADVIAELLETAQAGRAGKREYGLLLSLFASAPDEQLEGAGPVLRDLQRTLDPTDAGQLRRLARVWARLGDTARAARLYRWCGTRARSGGYFFYGMDQSGSVPTSVLVKEVGEELEGEELERTIEAILAFGDPGEDVRFGPGARDGYESLVLETWTEMLGAERALERCRTLCDRAAAGTRLPQRRTALLAAGLLARAGEVETALASLEQALCKLEPTPGLPAHMAFWFQNTGQLSRSDIRYLLPVEPAGWEDEQAWLKGLAKALPHWVEEGRANPAGLFEAVGILMLRLQRVGDVDRARALLPVFERWAQDSARRLLWVADVARELGDEALANRLEQRLFNEGRLNFHRVAEVIARMRTRDGAAAALEAGEAVAKYALHEKIVAELIKTAEAAGNDTRAAYWKQKDLEAKAARETLKALTEDE